MMLWLATTLTIYALCKSEHHNQFLHIGPSAETIVMGVVIDTWQKWGVLATLAFLKTCFNEFFENSLTPWIINDIQDTKTKELLYSKAICTTIVQLYQVYMHIMSVFGVALLLSQVDFLIIRILADALVTFYSMRQFMINKTVMGYEPVVAGSEHEETELADVAEGRKLEQ